MGQPQAKDSYNYHAIPYVSGAIVAHVEDEVDTEEGGGDLFGAVEIHNELSSGKSVLMPVALNHETRLASVICGDSQMPASAPQWFKTITEDPAAGIKKRECRRVMQDIGEIVESEGVAFTRMNFEIEIMVPKDAADNVLKANGSEKMNDLVYRIKEVGDGKSLVIAIDEMKTYMQNGHVFEMIMRHLLGRFWDYKDIDMPYQMCRNIRWLSASYLTKNTRGNLMPQITPIIEGVIKELEMAEMREGNSEWGALAALTMAIGGSK